LTGQSSKYARERRQIECQKSGVAWVDDSLRHGCREVESLSYALPYFLEPCSWIRAVNHSAEEAQAFGGVVAVPSAITNHGQSTASIGYKLRIELCEFGFKQRLVPHR